MSPRAGGRWSPHPRSAIWSPQGVRPPEGVSYFAHVDALLVESGRGPLARGGAPYPDDSPAEPGTPSWIAGALDGVLSLRGVESTGIAPTLVAQAIHEAIRHPLRSDAVHLVADRLGELDSVRDVDRIPAELDIVTPIGRQRIAELARWLCRFGTRTRQVQAGLALLAAFGGARDRALVFRLGLLHALTRHAVEALRAILDDPEPVVFDLARQTSGWGRIHAVYGLRGTTDPTIQDWLLRGGYDSGVIDEELAGIAAISGDLAGALQGRVDAELLHHAGRLLVVLVNGGAAEDLDDYAEGGLAIELYITNATEAEASVEILDVLQVIRRRLVDDRRRLRHIDEVSRLRLIREFDAVLADEAWTRVARAALLDPDIEAFRLAVEPARCAGVDVRSSVLARLEHQPDDGYLWQCLFDAAEDDDAVRDVVSRAARLLRVSDLESAPTSICMPDDERDDALDIMVVRLGRYPGTGWPLVRAGLLHRVARLRRIALGTLAQWDPALWPDDAPEVVARMVQQEPVDDIRERLVALSAPDSGRPRR